MLLIDERVGSADLVKPLVQAGLPAEKTHLDFADIAFEGKGNQDAVLSIGIELKTIGDLIGSLRSGRLAGHQLPGLRKTYDYIWLIVEGLWRHDEKGQLVTYQGKSRGWTPLHGRMSASELEKQVLTFELCGGFHVRYTNSRADTVRFLASLYHWWSDSSLDGHTSHLAIHNPPTLVPVSDFRQTVSKFPGIGIKTSLAVETHFNGSLRRAVNAGLDEWASITTLDRNGHARRLGIKDATRIVEFCNGGL